MKKNGFLKRMLACVLCMLMLVSACAFAEETAAGWP